MLTEHRCHSLSLSLCLSVSLSLSLSYSIALSLSLSLSLSLYPHPFLSLSLSLFLSFSISRSLPYLFASGPSLFSLCSVRLAEFISCRVVSLRCISVRFNPIYLFWLVFFRSVLFVLSV